MKQKIDSQFHTFDKDMFMLCTDVFIGEDIVDGYWTGTEFTSDAKKVLKIHKSNLDAEKIKADQWCKEKINDVIPYGYEIQTISKERDVELD